MQPLTPNDVQAVLDQHNLGIQIHFFETTTATVSYTHLTLPTNREV